MSKSQRSHRIMEQLEDRILFDAVPDGDFLVPQSHEQPLFVQEQSTIVNESMDQTGPRELILIDAGVQNANALINEILEAHPSKSFEVRLLSADENGVEQVSNILDETSDSFSAIHILSHGRDGALQLGNTTLDVNSLNGHAGEITLWTNSLTQDADILLYGCNLAATQEGEAFIEQLSLLTDADVAASNDVTGAATEGGDWDLEAQVGLVETNTLSAVAYSETLLASDNGFVIGTSANLGDGEIAVVPQGQTGTSSFTYANAATANNGAINVDVRLTLVDTFDENGVLTTGQSNQLPVTFGNWSDSPVLLSRIVGSSVNGYEGHTAEIQVEFFDSTDPMNPVALSIIGDFTFHDIDFNPSGGRWIRRRIGDDPISRDVVIPGFRYAHHRN